MRRIAWRRPPQVQSPNTRTAATTQPTRAATPSAPKAIRKVIAPAARPTRNMKTDRTMPRRSAKCAMTARRMSSSASTIARASGVAMSVTGWRGPQSGQKPPPANEPPQAGHSFIGMVQGGVPASPARVKLRQSRRRYLARGPRHHQTSPTMTHLEDRRRKRSVDPLVALHYKLAYARKNGALDAIVVADSSGVVVAGAGSWATCEELAAYAPLLAGAVAGDELSLPVA